MPKCREHRRFPADRGSLSASAAAGNRRPRQCAPKVGVTAKDLPIRRPRAKWGSTTGESPGGGSVGGENAQGRGHRRKHPQGFDQPEIRQCSDEARRGEARLRDPPDRRPAALQPGRRGEPDAGRHPLQERASGGRRRALRDAGAQPLDPRRHEERHRLGDAPARRTNAFKGKVAAISRRLARAASRPPSRSSISAPS